MSVSFYQYRYFQLAQYTLLCRTKLAQDKTFRYYHCFGFNIKIKFFDSRLSYDVVEALPLYCGSYLELQVLTRWVPEPYHRQYDLDITYFLLPIMDFLSLIVWNIPNLCILFLNTVLTKQLIKTRVFIFAQINLQRTNINNEI